MINFAFSAQPEADPSYGGVLAGCLFMDFEFSFFGFVSDFAIRICAFSPIPTPFLSYWTKVQ